MKVQFISAFLNKYANRHKKWNAFLPRIKKNKECEKKIVNGRKGKKRNIWECTVPNSMFSASN